MEIRTWTYETTQTCTVSERDVYRYLMSELRCPDGYQFTGEFRPPRKGETCLSTGLCGVWEAAADFDESEPRLILRPKPKMRTVSFEVPEGEEVVAFVTEPGRSIGYGTFYLGLSGKVIHHQCAPVFVDHPLKRIEPKP